ncbi:MAG: pre-peptidase C-terminal domain-containing protein [Bradymonadia bacterium]
MLKTFAYASLIALLTTACVQETSSSADDPEPDATAPDAEAAPDMGPVPIPDAEVVPDAQPAPEPDADIIPTTCEDEDDRAPNQTIDDAVPVEVGYTGEGLFICPETSDFFRVTLAARQVALIVLDTQPARVDLDLKVLNAEGVILQESAGETGRESITFNAPEAGDYLIEVTGFRMESAQYTLALRGQCQSDGQCPDDQICDPFERLCIGAAPARCGVDDFEPNDRDADGAPLMVDGGPVEGLFCRDDRDWFTFEAAAGDSYDLQVSVPQGEDVDVVVVDLATGRRVGTAFNDLRTNPEFISLSYLPAGRYAVGVFLFVPEDEPDREVSYRLDLVGRSGQCMSDNDCLAPENPRCDVDAGTCGPPENAGNVPLGGQCASEEDCTADADLCWTGREGGGDNVCTVGCRGNQDCAALGDGATCVRVSQRFAVCLPACESDNDCSDFRSCQAGSCELFGGCRSDADCPEETVCRQTEFGPFCGRAPTPTFCGDDGAPNDVAADATPIALGLATEGVICRDDEDWYTLEVPAESAGFLLSATLEPTGEGAEGVDLAMAVYDAQSNLVGLAAGDNNTEVAEIRLIPAGTHYVRVVLQGADALGDHPYALSLELIDNDERCDAENTLCDFTEPLRGACDVETGACTPIEGNGQLGLGARCDSADDCDPQQSDVCWSFEGGENGRNICTIGCQRDTDCDRIPGTTCVPFQGFAVCLPGE